MALGKKNREISIFHASFVDLFASVSAIFVIMTMVLMAQSQSQSRAQLNNNTSTVAQDSLQNPIQSAPSCFQQKLEGMQIGEKVSLPQVFFYPGVAKLLPGADEIIEDLAETLNNNTRMKIEVLGHIHSGAGGQTDEKTGNDLSQKRADTVCIELKQMGVNEDQLICRGMGATDLLVQTNDYYKAGVNRRVEIKVLDK